MNAAAQRRLTPWLAGGVAVLGAAFLILLAGVGRGIRWDAPHRAAPLPPMHAAALPPPPPLDGYAAVWQHPLFNSDRKPQLDDTAGGPRVSLGDLELTGIILTPGLRMALLRDKSAGDKDGGSEVRVREGDTLPDGSWKLVGLEPRSAVFASASGRTVLKLPAGAPIDAPSAAAPPAGARPPPGAVDVSRAGMGEPARAMRTGQPPIPPPPQGAQLQRMLRLKAAILKQRARQPRADDGDH
jgi:general secretion pathway protein N